MGKGRCENGPLLWPNGDNSQVSEPFKKKYANLCFIIRIYLSKTRAAGFGVVGHISQDVTITSKLLCPCLTKHCLFFFNIFIGVSFLYVVVLVSAV